MLVKKILMICLAVFALNAGCAGDKDEKAPTMSRIWEVPPVEQEEASPAPDQDGVHVNQDREAFADEKDAHDPPEGDVQIIAVVNGEAVTRDDLVKQLIPSHGLQVLQQQILLIAAQQRANEMGLSVSRKDIAAEHEDALERIATPLVNEAPKLDRQSAEQQLQQFLRSKNISRLEWENRMRRLAYLRKIARAEVDDMQITDKMLQREYNLAYGKRVQVRQLQVSSLAKIRRARSMLAAGKAFETVVRQLSENPLTASLGGLLPPFTRRDPSVSPLIREAAFELETGETSMTIPEGGVYHIIHVERRFPASGVKYENVDKSKLVDRLKDRLVRQRMDDLELELFQDASVDIRHERLRRQYEQRRGLN